MDALARIIPLVALAAVASCDRGVNTAAARGGIGVPAPRIVINEVMANPRAASDERGEWVELYNLESKPIDLSGWTIASRNDQGTVIERSVIVPPGGYAVLARDANQPGNGGVSPAYAYGSSVSLGNGADWIALRLPDGRSVDSVAWTSAIAGATRELRDAGAAHADVDAGNWATATSAFGLGDRGTPGRTNDGAVRPGTTIASTPPTRSATPPNDSGAPRLAAAEGASDSTLTVRVLDVGQGDAILIENGGSRVLVDGGPEPARFARLLDQLGLDGSTFDVGARAKREQLVYRDSDDPCGTGAPSCTITLRGGARLHVLRPDPGGEGPNNRSVAVKLVAADSTSFAMWLAGDAEQPEIRWFDATDYDRAPGMRASVLKGGHYGSCDGISLRYLDLVRPEIVVMSLAAANDYGYVHSQTLNLLRNRRIPWYRTDQNGTVTITSPRGGGRGYQVAVERGGPDMRGPSDRRARACGGVALPPAWDRRDLAPIHFDRGGVLVHHLHDPRVGRSPAGRLAFALHSARRLIAGSERIIVLEHRAEDRVLATLVHDFGEVHVSHALADELVADVAMEVLVRRRRVGELIVGASPSVLS